MVDSQICCTLVNGKFTENNETDGNEDVHNIHTNSDQCPVKLKLHLSDFSRICCTTIVGLVDSCELMQMN
jgi:hypothetical protein